VCRVTDIEELITMKSATFMKGIAIRLVLAFHMGDYLGVRLINPLGPAGVSLFLILSGCGINELYNLSMLLKKIAAAVIACCSVRTGYIRI
jgi:peptidoglycan/LPS O-acetylase OafA/YrhL